MSLRRRDLFRIGTLGGGIGLMGTAGWSVGKLFGARDTRPAPLSALDIDCTSAPSDTSMGNGYSVKFGPGAHVTGNRDNFHIPPARTPFSAEAREVDLSVIETNLEVADGQYVRVWTYGGTVPGPIIRATVGERINVTLTNRSEIAHSVHFHGAHDVMQDGLERVGKGNTKVYQFEAGPAGLHPYHCHIPPYSLHLRKGMYGAMIVDPLEPRPAAHEFVLCLCGFDTDGDGRTDIYTWNGLAGYYERFPLKVPVGELVRIYLTNMLEHDPIASFHLHAQTFDLYRSGTSLIPQEHTDIVGLGPAERAILEFRLPRRGRYMFHPHQSHMAERGAMGWIVAI
jgi:FtsP/CotA-like multicopper oxidase with cupredoxin domain